MHNFELKTTNKIATANQSGRIKQNIDSLRPDIREFVSFYGKKEIDQDIKAIQDYELKKNISKDEGLRDGLVLEGLLVDLDQNDFFYEDRSEERYNFLTSQSKDFVVRIAPTHKYDDYFNNTDLVGVMKNPYTRHRTIPFGIDCTTNSNPDKINKKMNYRRNNYNLPGFTQIKYFDDTGARLKGDNGKRLGRPTNEYVGCGNLPLIPKFVVGVDRIKSNKLLDMEQKKSDLAQYKDLNAWEQERLNQLSDEIDKLRAEISGLILLEIQSQTHQTISYLDNQINKCSSDNNIKNPDEQNRDIAILKTGKNMMESMRDYFDTAVEVARQAGALQNIKTENGTVGIEQDVIANIITSQGKKQTEHQSHENTF